MKSHSCLVLLSALALVLAVTANIVSLGAPNWIIARLVSGSPDNFTNKGLWLICYQGECSSFDGSQEGAWFLSTQILYTLSTAISIACLFLFCTLVVMPMNTKKMYGFLWLVTLGNVVASILITVALVVFGQHATEGTFEGVERNLFWAYYVAWIAAGFKLLSFLLLLGEICVSVQWYREEGQYEKF